MFGYKVVTEEYLEALREGARMDDERIEELEGEVRRLSLRVGALSSALRALKYKATSALADDDVAATKEWTTEKLTLGRVGTGTASGRAMANTLPATVTITGKET